MLAPGSLEVGGQSYPEFKYGWGNFDHPYKQLILAKRLLKDNANKAKDHKIHNLILKFSILFQKKKT